MTILCSEVIPTSRPPVAVIVAMALSLSLIFWFDFLLGTASRMFAKDRPRAHEYAATVMSSVRLRSYV